MQRAWNFTEDRREMADTIPDHRPWVTRLVTTLLIAVTVFGIVASASTWRTLAETAGLRASAWAWDDPASYVRLLSYQFVHGSVNHFVWNTLVLLLTGYVVERRNGSLAMLTVLIFGGIAAAVAHLVIFPNETRVLIGASGAVSALMGMAFVSAGDLTMPVRLPRRPRVYFRLSLRMALGLWLVLQLVLLLNKLVVVGGSPEVAYWSHFAGFASGVAVIMLLQSLTSIGGPARRDLTPASFSAGD